MNKLEKLKKDLFFFKKEHKKILPEYLKLQKKLTVISKKISVCQDKIDQETINADKIADKPNWKFILEENGVGSRSKNNRRRELLLNLLDCEGGGFYPEINQAAVRISLIKGKKESLEKTYNGLLKILPFIKIHPQYDGKIISILEHTLSNGGSYHLHINEKQNKYELDHSYAEAKEFPSLLDALKYIQENHWYKSSEEDSDY